MLTYLKLFILALAGGFFAALPVSYSAHFAFLNSVVSFSGNKDQLGFYFSVVSVVFALVVLFKLRRIYAKAVRISLSAKGAEPELQQTCRKMLLGLLICLLPAALMFVPVPTQDGVWVMDLLISLLQKDYLLVVAACCIGSGLFLLLAIWYTNQRYAAPHRSATPLGVLRFAVYQLPAFILPGVSHVATGSTALLLTDVEDNVIVREVLLYLAPPMLIVNVARIVRFVLSGAELQVVLLLIAVVGALLGTLLTLHLISKFNLRKTYLFFAIYSMIFGLLIVVTSFLF